MSGAASELEVLAREPGFGRRPRGTPSTADEGDLQSQERLQILELLRKMQKRRFHRPPPRSWRTAALGSFSAPSGYRTTRRRP